MQKAFQNISGLFSDWKFAHGFFTQTERMNFVSLGNGHEIRVIAQVGFSIVASVEKLLPLPHHAEIFVVDDYIHNLIGK